MNSQTTPGHVDVPVLVESAILYSEICRDKLEIVATRPYRQETIDLLGRLLLKGKVTHCKIESGVVVFLKLKTDTSSKIAKEAIKRASVGSAKFLKIVGSTGQMQVSTEERISPKKKEKI